MGWNCLSNPRFEISFANWRIINSYSNEHKMSFGMENPNMNIIVLVFSEEGCTIEMMRLTENNREVFSYSTTLPTTREFTIVEMRYKITEIVSLRLILFHRSCALYVMFIFIVKLVIPFKKTQKAIQD